MIITKDLIDAIPLNNQLDRQSRYIVHNYRWEQFALIFDKDYPELHLKILGMYNHKDASRKLNMIHRICRSDFKFRFKLETSLSYAELVSIPHNEFNKCIIKFIHYIRDKSPEMIYSWFR